MWKPILFYLLIKTVPCEKELSLEMKFCRDLILLGLLGRCLNDSEHGKWEDFILYHHSPVPWGGDRKVVWAYFAESIEVQQADETLHAVCFEDFFCTPSAKNFPLEEIFLDDHSVPVLIPAHRGEGVILHYDPELSWEGEPKKGPVSFLWL